MTRLGTGAFAAMGVVALGIGLTACAASPETMHHVKGAPVSMQPTAADAVLVFVRPAVFVSGALEPDVGGAQTIVDDKRRFLGVSHAASYFEVRMPPGDHLLIALGTQAIFLRTHLVPGKKYYVYFADEWVDRKGWTWKFEVVSPRTLHWASLSGWLAATPELVVDEKAGQADVDTNMARSDTDDKIAAVQKRAASLPANAPLDVGPDDGLAADESPPPPAAKGSKAAKK